MPNVKVPKRRTMYPFVALLIIVAVFSLFTYRYINKPVSLEKPSKAYPSFLKGINIDPYGRGNNPTVEELKLLGVNLVRIEIKDPNLDYGRIINQYSDAGIYVLAIIDYVTVKGAPFKGSASDWDKYLQNYSTTLNTVTLRYKNKVFGWEIWNEPDGVDWPVPEPVYAKMLKMSKEIIARNTNGYVVIGGLVSGNENYLRIVNASLTDSWAKYYDFVGLHPYGQRPANFNPGWGHGNLSDLYNRYSAFSKPILVTELGTDDVSVQSEYLTQSFQTTISNHSLTVMGIVWFCYSDHMVSPFGLKNTNDEKKSSYTAFANAVLSNMGACKGGNCMPLSEKSLIISPEVNFSLPVTYYWTPSSNQNATYILSIESEPSSSSGSYIYKFLPKGTTKIDLNLQDLKRNIQKGAKIKVVLYTMINSGSNPKTLTDTKIYNATSDYNMTSKPISTPKATPTPVPQDTIYPFVNIDMPQAGSTVSGKTKIIISGKDEREIGSYTISIDDVSKIACPGYNDYCEYTWDSTSYTNGQHKISALILDASYNPAYATTYVTVYNSPTLSLEENRKLCNADANKDKSINSADLALIKANYNKKVAKYTQGDVDGNGILNLSDIALISAMIGKLVPSKCN